MAGGGASVNQRCVDQSCDRGTEGHVNDGSWGFSFIELIDSIVVIECVYSSIDIFVCEVVYLKKYGEMS